MACFIETCRRFCFLCYAFLFCSTIFSLTQILSPSGGDGAKICAVIPHEKERSETNSISAYHFLLWQLPDIAHSLQPQPQEDLPFLLFLINEATINAITARSMVHIIIVDKFSVTHLSILKSSFAFTFL